MKVSEPDAVTSHAIEIRSLDDLIAVTAEVAVAQVIAENQNDVGPLALLRVEHGRTSGGEEDRRCIR